MTVDPIYGEGAEHLAWCKERALEYLDQGDLVNALASFISDMSKHPDTNTPAAQVLLGMEGIAAAQANSASRMRKLIEGFR